MVVALAAVERDAKAAERLAHRVEADDHLEMEPKPIAQQVVTNG